MARFAGTVCGVDVSTGMLKRAQQHFENQNLANTAFLEISALDEMFPEAAFQVVTSFNMLQYVENRGELFLHFNRLLESGGTLMIAVPCFGDATALSTSYVKFLRFVRIMPETCFFRVGEIENEIEGAGFAVVESIDMSGLPEKLIVAKKL